MSSTQQSISLASDEELMEVTDVDVIYGPNDTLPITLRPEDEIEFPVGRLADGDVRIEYASGEVVRLNGALIKWISTRTRLGKRKKTEPKKTEPKAA